MGQIKVGIIGMGQMGNFHAGFLKELPQLFRLTAIFNPTPKALEPFRETAQCFTDSEQFFNEADIDAVMVSTIHFFHHSFAIEALKHGKHVLIEKPLSVHKALAQQLIDEINAHPELRCGVMFNMRTRQINMKIKQLIDSGELGDIQRFSWTVTDWFRNQAYYNSSAWRATWKGEGGGVLMNQCPHQLDLLQWFFGMPTRIFAHADFGKFHNIEVEDCVTAFMQFANGATGVFITSTGEAPGTNRLEIVGDRGRLVCENGKLTFDRTEGSVKEFIETCPQRDGKIGCWHAEIPIDASKDGNYITLWSNFYDSITKGEPLLVPAVEGINAVELSNAMLLSTWQDKAVDLPIDAALFESLLNERIAQSRK